MKNSENYIRYMSIALAEFCFRNSDLLENLHSTGRPITNDDMMQLNKYAVNHIAFVLELIKAHKIEELDKIMKYFYTMGSTWDDPEIDEDLKSLMSIYNIKEEELKCQ